MKNKKMWIVASVISVIAGSIILTVGILMGGHPGFYINRNGLHTAAEENKAEIFKGSEKLEAFDSIELTVDYADVEIEISDRFAVEYCLAGKEEKLLCEVKNRKFTFKEGNYTRYVNFGFFTSTGIQEEDYYVRIEIPEGTKLSEASLYIDAGNLDIESLQADELKIVNEYGDVSLDTFEGRKFKLKQDSGDTFIGVLNAEQAEIENEYGNIEIDEAAGDDLKAVLDSGNFQVLKLDVSDVEVRNEYGDAMIDVSGDIEDYALDLCTEFGYIRAGGVRLDDDDEVHYRTKGAEKKRIEVYCEDGKIEVN